jgi:hypothetical protein
MPARSIYTHAHKRARKAVGCIFAEVVSAKELFCGKEVAGRSAPFQADQVPLLLLLLLLLPVPYLFRKKAVAKEHPQALTSALSHVLVHLHRLVGFGHVRALQHQHLNLRSALHVLVSIHMCTILYTCIIPCC